MPIVRKIDHYFISAGEHSGDLLAADLVLALKHQFPRLKSFGVTGPAMRGAGVQSIADINSFSVMGVAEVAKRLPDLRVLETEILSRIDRIEPSIAILVDNPGFHFRLAEQLRMRNIPVIQYVAPKVWAWGGHRVERLKSDFTRVLGILPFEEGFFRRHNVPYDFVGSPQKDRTEKVMVSRENLGLRSDQKVVACLPGSRMTEVQRIVPLLMAIRDQAAQRVSDAVFMVPVAQNLDFDEVVEIARSHAAKLGHPEDQNVGLAAEVVAVGGLHFVRGMSLEIMAAADAAVVASGTATLECALLGTPMVVVYSMNEMTYQMAQKAVKVPYISLANLIADRRIVNEFIQDFSIGDVVDDLVELMTNDVRRRDVIESFEDLRDRLPGGAATNAAARIKSLMPHLGGGVR